MGSASELDYHLLLAKDLKLIQTNQYRDLARQTSEVKRMLTGLFQRLSRNCSELGSWFEAKAEGGGFAFQGESFSFGAPLFVFSGATIYPGLPVG